MDRSIHRYLVFVFTILSINALFLMTSVHANTEKDLEYMTEKYPPFNFVENGELKGIAVDVLEEMFKRMNSKLTRKHIQIYTWSMAYERILKNRNKMLFSMVRTEERENLFKWVGPVAENRIVIIARKDRPVVINSPEDLFKYKYGVIEDDIGEKLLLEAGLKKARSYIDKANIYPAAKAAGIMKMMKRKRLDAWAYGESVAKWLMKKHGYDPSDFKTVHVLLKKGDLYFAFQKDTPDGLIQKFQHALDSLKKKSGSEKSEYDKIVDRYLN